MERIVEVGGSAPTCRWLNIYIERSIVRGNITQVTSCYFCYPQLTIDRALIDCGVGTAHVDFSRIIDNTFIASTLNVVARSQYWETSYNFTMSLIHIIESLPVRALAALIRAIQSPFFSGPLLAALLYAPEELTAKVLQHVPPSINIQTTITVLKVLFGIGVVKTLNRGLSSMAANSWRVSAAKGWNWPNEIAVVTGGCSGIGHSVVKGLTARGVKVAVLDVQALPRDLASNRLVRYYKCDITSPELVAATAKSIRADLGNPSILVNNAGIAKSYPILEMPQEFLQKIFDINCLSHWTLVQQFLPHMVKVNKGHIVTVASIASFVPMPLAADYAATKAGALSFHESLSIELKHIYKADSVLTTVVHPNFVQTPLVKDYSAKLEKGGVRWLTADRVAGTITDQIFKKRGAQLIIPEQHSSISGLRGLPTWMQALIADQVGSNMKKLGF